MNYISIKYFSKTKINPPPLSLAHIQAEGGVQGSLGSWKRSWSLGTRSWFCHLGPREPGRGLFLGQFLSLQKANHRACLPASAATLQHEREAWAWSQACDRQSAQASCKRQRSAQRWGGGSTTQHIKLEHVFSEVTHLQCHVWLPKNSLELGAPLLQREIDGIRVPRGRLTCSLLSHQLSWGSFHS